MPSLSVVVRMSSDPGAEAPGDSVSVSTPEVRVEKAFAADRFPVPAIAFEIESLADEPVDLRVVDRIPESFPMEGIGFHPDYDSDNWTAYRDNRVEYVRTLDAGESVLTVYGVRIDDPSEAEQFMAEPTVETTPVDAAASVDGASDGAEDDAYDDDVLGRETTRPVRDALSGTDDDSELSGLGADTPSDDAPIPRELDDDATVVLGEGDDEVSRMDEGEDEDEDEDETLASADAAVAADPRRADGDEDVADRAESPDDHPEKVAKDEAEDDTPPARSTGAGGGAVPGSVAAALAAELRDGTVDDADLAALQDALETELPTSVDVRIQRLQSQVEDLSAYREALAEFLDENGTAEAVLEEVRAELDEVTDQVEAVEETVGDAAADTEAVVERLDGVEDRLASLEADLTERLDGVEGEIADVESRVDALEADVEERLDDIEADVEERLDDVEAEFEDVHDELAELDEFRERLSSAFGPGDE
jgi:predicted  nucleic acid-binding Zn-ribbon protein